MGIYYKDGRKIRKSVRSTTHFKRIEAHVEYGPSRNRGSKAKIVRKLKLSLVKPKSIPAFYRPLTNQYDWMVTFLTN